MILTAAGVGAGFLRLNFAVVFAATALVLLLGIIGIFTYLRRKESRTVDPKRGDIDGMDIKGATKAVASIIADPSKFLVVRHYASDFPFAEELPKHVVEFFSEIESIKAVRGDAELTRSSIARSQLNQDYIRIGRDIESVEVSVRSAEETVYEIDAFDPSKPFDQHRSIYHWLLAVNEALYGD